MADLRALSGYFTVHFTAAIRNGTPYVPKHSAEKGGKYGYWNRAMVTDAVHSN